MSTERKSCSHCAATFTYRGLKNDEFSRLLTFRILMILVHLRAFPLAFLMFLARCCAKANSCRAEMLHTMLKAIPVRDDIAGVRSPGYVCQKATETSNT